MSKMESLSLILNFWQNIWIKEGIKGIFEKFSVWGNRDERLIWNMKIAEERGDRNSFWSFFLVYQRSRLPLVQLYASLASPFALIEIQNLSVCRWNITSFWCTISRFSTTDERENCPSHWLLTFADRIEWCYRVMYIKNKCTSFSKFLLERIMTFFDEK